MDTLGGAKVAKGSIQELNAPSKVGVALRLQQHLRKPETFSRRGFVARSRLGSHLSLLEGGVALRLQQHLRTPAHLSCSLMWPLKVLQLNVASQSPAA